MCGVCVCDAPVVHVWVLIPMIKGDISSYILSIWEKGYAHSANFSMRVEPFMIVIDYGEYDYYNDTIWFCIYIAI